MSTNSSNRWNRLVHVSGANAPVHLTLAFHVENKSMDQSALSLLSFVLLLGSIASGPYAISFAAREGFGGATGIMLLGIASGIAGLIASLKGNAMHYAALKRAGQPVINDMPGFGQALLFGAGAIFFAAVFLIVSVVAIWRQCSRKERKNK